MQMTHNCIFYTPQTFSSCPFLTSCLQAIITWINLNGNKSHVVLISSEDHLHQVYWPHTPALIQLHWLPVLQRIKYKNLFLKAVSDSAQPVFPGLLPPHTLSVLSAQLQLFSELLTSGRTPWMPEPSAVLHLIFGVYYHYTFVSLTLCHSHISHKLYVLHSYYSWILNVFNVVLVDLGCKVTLSCYYYYYWPWPIPSSLYACLVKCHKNRNCRNKSSVIEIMLRLK